MLRSKNRRRLFIFSIGASRLPSLDTEVVEKWDAEGVNGEEVSPPKPTEGMGQDP